MLETKLEGSNRKSCCAAYWRPYCMPASFQLKARFPEVSSFPVENFMLVQEKSLEIRESRLEEGEIWALL